MKKSGLMKSKRLWRETKSEAARLLWWREPPPPGRKTMQALSEACRTSGSAVCVFAAHADEVVERAKADAEATTRAGRLNRNSLFAAHFFPSKVAFQRRRFPGDGQLAWGAERRDYFSLTDPALLSILSQYGFGAANPDLGRPAPAQFRVRFS